MDRYLCIDIGGTTIKYSVLDKDGQTIEATQEMNTPDGG